MAAKRSKIPVLPGQGALFTKTQLTASGLIQIPILRTAVLECEKCQLSKGRHIAVFGEGLAECPQIAFVGEAPGENEDRTGRPFIGKAGRQLDELLEEVRIRRAQVWVTNAVACRPFMNRTPEPEELRACREHLFAQLHAVRPRVIVCLGKTAAQAVTGKTAALSDLRGVWHRWVETPVRVTYHPSFLLREGTPEYVTEAIQDLQMVRRYLDGEGSPA